MIPSHKYYLNIGKASDLKNSKERLIYRSLEIFPGALIWGTLIGMVVFSWFRPVWIAYFIMGFCVYWLLKITYFSIYMTVAYRQLKKNLAINWLKRLKSERKKLRADWENIYHLIVLPTYKEGPEIIRETFRNLVNCEYPKEKIIVVLAIEERAGESAKEIAKDIAAEFGNRFYRFLVTRHPKDLPGEIAGKGSNNAWAAKKAKEEIVDPAKIPYANIIISSFDADTQVYPHYFSRLTYSYLTSSHPTRSSFQPIPLYLNNIWEAPFFSRVVAFSNVFWQALQQQRPEKLVTYSSHSMSFKAVVEMNFWQKNVVSEDAGIFWKSFLFYDGDYRIVPLHYPVSMDCVADKTFIKTIIAQYKQQRRWAWGSEGIPYLLFGFLKNKKIHFKKKFHYSFLLIEGFWAWATNAFIIFLLGWLPVFLGGDKFNATVLSYNLPRVTGSLMTVALIGLLVCIVISFRLLSPRPPKYSKWKTFSMLTQWIFFPLTFIFFGSVPATDAQTRLMLGKYMGFTITEKTRK